MTRAVVTLLGGVALGSCARATRLPDWVSAFGYEESALHAVEVRDFGFPFVPVGIGQDTVWLPFDTGNMAGLTLATDLFERFGLPCSDRWNRRDSSGAVVSTGCVAAGVRVSAFGATDDSVRVLEFVHDTLPGLVGPDRLPGTRVTLDYEAGLLASDGTSTPAGPVGFVSIPLIRSPRHSHLILAMGQVEGHPALFEVDTGKSRTTVDRALVDALGLASTDSGVRIERVRLGPREWTVDGARVVDTSGISEGLPDRISLGVGSDVLRGFVFTVDYTTGVLWVENPR